MTRQSGLKFSTGCSVRAQPQAVPRSSLHLVSLDTSVHKPFQLPLVRATHTQTRTHENTHHELPSGPTGQHHTESHCTSTHSSLYSAACQSMYHASTKSRSTNALMQGMIRLGIAFARARFCCNMSHYFAGRRKARLTRRSGSASARCAASSRRTWCRI